jgi:hypothetical protein
MASPLPPSPDNKGITLDEWIAVALSFSVIGAILFWSIGKNSHQIKNANFLDSPTSPASSLTPEKLAELKPTTPRVSQTLPIPTVNISPFFYNPQPDYHRLPLILPTSSIPSVTAQEGLKPQTNSAKIAKSIAKSSPKSKSNLTQTVPLKFSDVPEKYWAKPFIDNLAERKIVAGFKNGKFQPEKPVTRAELAAIIAGIATQPKLGQKSLNLRDVKANIWAVPAINKSVQSGFMKVYPENSFRPDQFVTKAQVLAALASGFNFKTPAKSTKTLEIYQDSKRIPTWALTQVAAATEANIVVNYPKREFLNPNQPATRANVVAMVYQTLVKLEKAKPLSSDYIVRR